MNEDTDFIYDSEAEPNMRTTLPSSPVSELVERLRSTVGYSPYIGYALVAETADRLTALEAALRRIVERSHNDPLGTSKVIDMRKIAEEALTAPQGGDHGE